jgi:hypothetical protein
MPHPLKPNDIVLALRDAIDPHVRAAKGITSIASDAFHVLELLGESPAGFRVVILWEGDADATGQPLAGIVEHTLAIVISHNRGLRVWNGENLHRDTSAGPSLLTRLTEIRTLLLRYRFPEDITDCTLLYLGSQPEVTPEGLPLDAYRMRFRLHASIDMQ